MNLSFQKNYILHKGINSKDDINNRVIQIDINTPKDFYDKLIILSDKQN